MEAPPLSRMTAARNTVMARKKTIKQKSIFSLRFLTFLSPNLKFYPLGISMLMIALGAIYMTETHYSAGTVPGFSDNNCSTLSVKSSTVSVNSSTMLTSIPTLRN